MMGRNAVIAACLLASAPACIPGRDNPADPTNAPVIEAYVTQLLPVPANGTGILGCPANPPSAGSAVGSAPRRACLGFDASATTDPNQRTPITFTLEVPYTGVLSNQTGRFVLPVELNRSAVPGSSLTFTLTAKNAAGDFSFAKVGFIFEDEAPQAASPLRAFIPTNGFPWAPGMPVVVPLDDSGSLDRDDPGDPQQQFCWTLDQDPESCSNAPLSFRPSIATAPGSPGQHVARLVVRDRWGAASRASITTIDVSNAPVWLSAANSPSVRVDSIATNFSASLPRAPARMVFGGRYLWLLDTSASTLETWSFPTPGAAPIQSVPVGTSEGGMAIDELGSLLFFAASTGAGRSLLPFLVDAGGTLTPATPVALGTEIPPPFVFERVRIDRRGNAWVTEEVAGTTLFRVHDPTGSPQVASCGHDAASTLCTLGTDRVFAGFDTRPVAGSEAWALESRDVYANSPTGQSPVLHRFVETSNGVLTATSIPLTGRDTAVGLEFVDARTFWTFVPGEGLYLIDADAAAAVGFDNAVVLAVPGLNDVQKISVDPASGVCWAFPSDGVAYAITPLGDVRTYSQQQVDVAGFDPEGGMWFDSGINILRGIVPTADALISSSFTTTATRGALDSRDGGLWTAGEVPNSLIHFDSLGGAERYSTTIRWGDGSTRALDALFPLVSVPDGSALYGVERDFSEFASFYPAHGMIRIDLSGSEPIASQIMDATTAQNAFEYSGGKIALLQASSPGGTNSFGQPFFWTYRSSASEFGVVTTSGTYVPVFTVPGGETVPVVHADRSTQTNRLCVATVDSATPKNVRIRWIEPGQSPILITTLATPATDASGLIWDVATTADATRDVCWVAYGCNTASSQCNQGTHIEGYLPNGTLVHSYVNPAVSTFSILPTSPDQVWATVGGLSLQTTMHRLDWGVNPAPVDESRILTSPSVSFARP